MNSIHLGESGLSSMFSFISNIPWASLLRLLAGTHIRLVTLAGFHQGNHLTVQMMEMILGMISVSCRDSLGCYSRAGRNFLHKTSSVRHNA